MLSFLPFFFYEETEAPRGNFRDVCMAVYTWKKYMSYACQVGSFTLPILYRYLFKCWETGTEVNELSKDRTAREWQSSALSCLQSPSHSAPHVVPVCWTPAQGSG